MLGIKNFKLVGGEKEEKQGGGSSNEALLS